MADEGPDNVAWHPTAEFTPRAILDDARKLLPRYEDAYVVVFVGGVSQSPRMLFSDLMPTALMECRARIDLEIVRRMDEVYPDETSAAEER